MFNIFKSKTAKWLMVTEAVIELALVPSRAHASSGSWPVDAGTSDPSYPSCFIMRTLGDATKYGFSLADPSALAQLVTVNFSRQTAITTNNSINPPVYFTTGSPPSWANLKPDGTPGACDLNAVTYVWAIHY